MSFRAGVQYGDYRGTAAADRADKNNISDYLREQGLIEVGEFPIALEVWIGENHGGEISHVSIDALLVQAGDYDGAVQQVLKQDPVPVRRVELPLTLDQFIGKFKRFAVTLTLRGANLDDKDYREI